MVVGQREGESRIHLSEEGTQHHRSPALFHGLRRRPKSDHPSGGYTEADLPTSGSRHNGFLPYTAEGLLRESIKVSMVSLGYPDLWRLELNRIIAKAVMAGGWK